MLRINDINVLEEKDLRETCPAFYATVPRREKVSDKYTFLNTKDIASQLWDLGWMPTQAVEVKSRSEANIGVNKHMIRFAHRDFNFGDERIELVGVNSHNTSAAFKIMAGVFRLVCSNGMVVQDADFGSFSIKHVGDIGDQVAEAVQAISGNAHQIASKMDDFKAIELTPDEQGKYALAAHQYIYPDRSAAPIMPRDLLTTRRYEDAQDNLWSTFNRVQENVMRGGIRGVASTGRRYTTRAVKSIDKDVKLNQALWTLTEHMAELKAA